MTAEGAPVVETDSVPLTERGRAQAKLAGEALRSVLFDRVLASPLLRTMETARLVVEGREHRQRIETLSDLREISEGDYGDLPEASLRRELSYAYERAVEEDARYAGGVSYVSFAEQVRGAIFPLLGLYATTVLMSIGFHYFEAMQLATIWNSFKSSQAARKLGRQIGSKSLGAVGVFTMLWFASEVFGLSYKPLYMMCGGVTLVIVLFIVLAFPEIKAPVQQAKKPVLRKQYWLYYALTLMSGARRQIFVVFAGFLMVEKFHYSIGEVALLFLANNILQIWLAPYAGRLIERWGERNALLLEYSGLLFVFLGYVVVSDARVAGALYLLDHIFFSLTIAMNSYFRHIARPQDISASAAVGFTINHVAAVVLPVTLGFVWLVSPGRVFLLGAGLALFSLFLSFLIPNNPRKGYETRLVRGSAVRQAT